MNLEKLLRDMGYKHVHKTPGAAGWCGTERMLYTAALVVGMDDAGYSGRYCYATEFDAAMALMSWDGNGDPPGKWIKYKGQGGERLGPGAVER